MNYSYRFDQVLTIREQERTQAELAYQEAMSEFESIAVELYELMKKKEEAASEQDRNLKEGISVNGIRHYSNFVEGLEKTIEQAQSKVRQARFKMSWHEEKLLEKSVEVQKYEKMKKRDFERFRIEQARLDSSRLDELVTVQHFTKEIR